MTICKLVETRSDLERIIVRINSTIKVVSDNFAEINRLEKKANGEGEAAIELARASANALIMDLNESKAQLQNYSALLGDVMRQTEIGWPPKCICD